MSEQLRWCPACERSVLVATIEEHVACPRCGTATTRISWLTAALRKISLGPERRTDLQAKHLELIQSIWTADGMGQRLFEVCQPGSMYYSRFVRAVTVLICRGIEEGWITLRLPTQPLASAAEYSITYLEPERFVAELEALFPGKAARKTSHP